MIKFTDEFIEEANYLYQLAIEISDLSLAYLDKLEDKLFIKRLNDIFKSTFNRIVNHLSREYNRPVNSAMQNYLISLCCLNENALACEFLDDLVLD